MQHKKGSEGFTLVEVIISIAVLSIVSVFILQMFVISAQLNANARDIDKVNMWTSTLMETFYLSEDPMAFDQAFADPVVERDEGRLSITCYFDEDWAPAAPDGERAFMLRAVVAHEEDGPSVPIGLFADAPTVRGALFSLSIQLTHLDVAGMDVLLGQTTNVNYFQLQEAAP